MRRLASGAGGATVWRLVFIVSGCSAVIWGRARCTLLALGGGACGHAVPHGTVNITQFRHVSDTLACYRGHAVFDSSQRWRPAAGPACPGSGGASSPARPPRTAAPSAQHDGCRRCSTAIRTYLRAHRTFGSGSLPTPLRSLKRSVGKESV